MPMTIVTREEWTAQGYTGTAKPILYVNNTGSNIDMFHKLIRHSIETLEPLHEDIDDIFHLTVRVGYNSDGTNCGMVEFA